MEAYCLPWVIVEATVDNLTRIHRPVLAVGWRLRWLVVGVALVEPVREGRWAAAVGATPNLRWVSTATRFVLMLADTRCSEPDHDHAAEPLPDALMYQSICRPCRWHVISDQENEVVEGWHDHAMPGWRDLPVIPGKLAHFDTPRQRAAAQEWIARNYPAAWQRDGAPVRTVRRPHATRHVRRRPPMGGYDLAVPTDETTVEHLADVVEQVNPQVRSRYAEIVPPDVAAAGRDVAGAGTRRGLRRETPLP